VSDHPVMTIRCPECARRVLALPNPTTADRLGSYRQVGMMDQWACNVCGHTVTILSRDDNAPPVGVYRVFELLRAVEVDLRHDMFGEDRKRMRAMVLDAIELLGKSSGTDPDAPKRRGPPRRASVTLRSDAPTSPDATDAPHPR
jgi:DNA-directed RNA polymerase subunit RPC12/RpoP